MGLTHCVDYLTMMKLTGAAKKAVSKVVGSKKGEAKGASQKADGKIAEADIKAQEAEKKVPIKTYTTYMHNHTYWDFCEFTISNDCLDT